MEEQTRLICVEEERDIERVMLEEGCPRQEAIRRLERRAVSKRFEPDTPAHWRNGEEKE
jgi:hypothetical protein